MTLRVAAIAPGDPFAVGTFSGIGPGLLGAIRDRGALVGAVDGYPGWLRRVELVASFKPGMARWRQHYYGGISPIGPRVREGMSAVARRRVAPIVREHDADALLQLTGWYRPAVPDVLRASYHDGNLASYLAWPDLLVDRDSRAVRRLLRWERRLYDETAVIFTMSEWLRRTFIDEFGQDPEKVVAVGGGSDLPDVPEFEHSWDPPRFLFVGREFARKGGPEVLRAWPAVRAQYPNAELQIVGPREIEETLPAGVTLAGRIHRDTPEGRDAYLEMYRRATAFVMPSLYESFGIVFLEAMAHGLGCVAANRCAMPEIVEDGVTGRAVDPTDPDALAGALIELADPDTARRMGYAARRRLLERFTWPVVADRILTELTARIQRTRR